MRTSDNAATDLLSLGEFGGGVSMQRDLGLVAHELGEALPAGPVRHLPEGDGRAARVEALRTTVGTVLGFRV